ncbi:uncharacterized protein LOC111019519 [Momordica charantia]|uniref:Uncharacterized protein LOC111019519 n=1 Tax=Momordica charantia TaxID=3673 RepID=A0A6J1DDZ3_MOMCH|nr:uncharacterized protein LOC111019519 [Momordica charantia]
MTSNIAESMNAVLVYARYLPVTTLLEYAHALLQRWFYERQIYASSRETILTDYGENKMHTIENFSRIHSITPIYHHELEVSNGLKRVRVNSNARTCGCKDGHLWNVNKYTLCSPAYTLQTLINAYAEPVYPLGDDEDWIIPDDFVDRKVEPPKYVPRVGQCQTV